MLKGVDSPEDFRYGIEARTLPSNHGRERTFTDARLESGGAGVGQRSADRAANRTPSVVRVTLATTKTSNTSARVTNRRSTSTKCRCLVDRQRCCNRLRRKIRAVHVNPNKAIANKAVRNQLHSRHHQSTEPDGHRGNARRDRGQLR